jgi:hypothetical protein
MLFVGTEEIRYWGVMKERRILQMQPSWLSSTKN